ncbi:MAG: histidine phosphotransferase family protein [Rhodospirillaceae bacterium]|jgi:histidine phosphotransferase ChpT
MTDDLQITQLLCSRLCHDLVGPVGAINNGIELIEDAPDMLEDSLSLLNNSAAQASRRLAFYRAAFGFGGGDGPGALKDVRGLSQDFVAESSVNLHWPDESVMTPLPKNGVKLLMNLILLGVGTLIRGGELTVQISEQENEAEMTIAAAGQGAKLKEDLHAALGLGFPVADLTAHTVQAQFAARLAQSVGGKIAVTETGTENGDEVTFTAACKNSL